MIVLKCKKSDYEFIYDGNIEIDIIYDDDILFVCISSDKPKVSSRDTFLDWDYEVYDRFFYEEVEYIRSI